MSAAGSRGWQPEVLVLALGLLISLTAYRAARDWEAQRHALAFHEDVEIYALAIQQRLQGLVADVQAIARLYDAADAVSAAAFARFTRPLLAQNPSIQALEWAPRVLDADRETWEAEVRGQGLADFAIRERVAGALRPADRRAEYFPVYRLEPLAGNAPALGFDLGSEPLRRAALERARDTGQPAATPPVTLVQEPADQRGLVIFVPQDRTGVMGATPQARREQLAGVAVGVVRLGALMDAVVSALPPRGVDLVLRDTALPAAAGLLQVHPSRTREPGATLDPALLAHDPRGFERQLEVAGRTLELRAVPAPGTPASRWPLTLLGLGLVLSSALAALVGHRRRATAQLRASERRWKFAVEGSAEGLWDLDLSTDTAYYSPRYLALLGYAEGDLTASAEAWAQRVHPDDLPRALELGHRHLRGESAFYECEFRMRCKDGSYRWTLSRGQVVERRPDGTAQRMIGTMTDISERKAAEEAIRTLNAELEQRVALRTAEAVAASTAKTEFLANVSHEIRTPMNGILGLTQILERETLAPAHRHMVQRIHRAGQSLLRILNDILDFSKIEAGQLRVEHGPFTLAPVLTQVQDLLDELARAKGLVLRITPPAGDAPRLLGDPLRLEQVLVNLIGNAVKFTERGEVVVSVCYQDRSAHSVRLCGTVRDTGIGIAPEHLALIFKPFVQADGSISRRFGGTGLGLSISKQLIEQMGGTLGVESTPGVGSCFRFALPLDLADTPAPVAARTAAPTAAGPRLRGLHCLVVDDSAMNLEVLERVLTREGARVTLAADGRQALACLRAHPCPFAAVLLDIQMPDFDGLAVTRAIRSTLALAELPVIAVSAGAQAGPRQAALAAGANDFLAKPVEVDALVAVLLRWTAPPAGHPAAAPTPAAELPAIPGLDTRRAATLLGHDRSFFLDLLRRFAAESGDLTRQVRADLADGQPAAAAGRLHRLRGSGGHIGALALGAAAQALESALLAGQPDPAPLLERFDGQLAALLSALAPWTTEPGQQSPDTDYETVPDPVKLSALRVALARHDLAALNLFTALQPALAGRYGQPAVRRLAASITALRFADALAQLVELPEEDV